MSGSQTANFRLITAVVAVLAVIGYGGVQAPEPPGKLPQPAPVAAEPKVSNFVASGGLVPGSAPTPASADEGLGQAAVKRPASSGAATF